MFYGVEILSRKGKLGIIWLAATYGKKRLTNRQFRSVNIPRACDTIINPPTEFSLRLSAILTLGVVRIYSEQIRFFYSDVFNTMGLVKLAFKSVHIDHPHEQAREQDVTLPELATSPITQIQHEFLRFPQMFEGSSSSGVEDSWGISSGFESPVGDTTRRRMSTSTPPHKTPPPGPNQASPDAISLPSDEDVTKTGVIRDQPPYINDFEMGDNVPPEDLPEPPDIEMPQGDQGISPIQDGKQTGEIGPGDDTDVRLINPVTGQLETVSPVTREEKPLPRPEEITPRVKQPLADKEPPRRPAKKQRRSKPKGPLIDTSTQLPARRSLQYDVGSERRRRRTPHSPTAAELFRTPAKEESGFAEFRDMWQRNAFVVFQEYVPSSPSEDEDEIEQRRVLRESGISDQPSGLSRLSVDSETGSRLDLNDLTMGEPIGEGEDFGHVSPTGVFSPVPELSPVPEEQELETDFIGFGKESEGVRENGNDTEIFLRKLREAMQTHVEVFFKTVFPVTTPRKEAARMFYQALAMVKSGVIVMEQDEPFGEIRIFIGPNW